MKPLFFEQFGAWLEEHHQTATELWVGFHKKASGTPSITWAEAVEQALRFGWIDGVRRSIDGDSYTNRFTPRRPTSNWSAINVAKVEELKARGPMAPAGLRAYEARTPERTGVCGDGRRPGNGAAAGPQRRGRLHARDPDRGWLLAVHAGRRAPLRGRLLDDRDRPDAPVVLQAALAAPARHPTRGRNP